MDKKAVFIIPKQSKYIIFGHSHPECAFNDSLIQGFSNRATSGESYFYTYFKLKKILEQNKSVEAVFIEFTNNQILPEKDKWIWDDGFLDKNYSLYSPFMNTEDDILLFTKNPSGYINALSVSFDKNLSYYLRDDLDYSNRTGGYNYLVRNKTDSILSARKNISVNRTSEIKSISSKNLEYLNKIIEHCKRNGVDVYFVRSPLHPQYDGYYNEKEFKSCYLSNYPDIELLDFSQYPLPNSEFADLEHLNHAGAKNFSIWFNHLMEDGLLNEENKQLMIDESINYALQATEL